MTNDRSQLIPEHLAPRKGEVTLFDNPLLERLSRITPWTVLMIYVPVTLFAAARSLTLGVSLPMFVLLSTCGFLFWTLFEYAFHRYVFHFSPKSEFQHQLLFLIHGVHHQYPNDKERLVMPVSVSLMIAGVLLLLFIQIMGAAYGWAFFTGFIAGYLAYDMMHYSIHHVPLPEHPVLRAIWIHHLAHHYQDTTRGYGVSSPMWDQAFGSVHRYEKNRK